MLTNISESSQSPSQGISTPLPIHFMIHGIISFIIAGIGIMANGAVIIIIILSSSLRSTNTFMLFCNLAIADFILATTIPFTGSIMLNKGYFHYGLFLCKAIPVIQTTVIIVSSLTLVVISIDRSLAIAKPFFFELWCDAKAIRIAIILTWISGFTFASPQLHFLTLTPFKYCYIHLQPQASIAYQIVGMIIQFFLPLISGIISYIIIHKVLHKMHQLPCHLQPDLHQLNYAKRRAKIAFIIIIVYILSSIGFYALLFAEVLLRSRYLKDRQLHFVMYNVLYAFRMVAYSSSVWNPFIYTASSPLFRQCVKNVSIRASVGPAPVINQSTFTRDISAITQQIYLK